jgi:hypothetical protein
MDLEMQQTDGDGKVVATAVVSGEIIAHAIRLMDKAAVPGGGTIIGGTLSPTTAMLLGHANMVVDREPGARLHRRWSSGRTTVDTYSDSETGRRVEVRVTVSGEGVEPDIILLRVLTPAEFGEFCADWPRITDED